MDTESIMNAQTDRRDCDLHVQISKKNKRFLSQQSKRLGVVMGLYLDKMLSALRFENNGKKQGS